MLKYEDLEIASNVLYLARQMTVMTSLMLDRKQYFQKLSSSDLLILSFDEVNLNKIQMELIRAVKGVLVIKTFRLQSLA